MRCCHARREWLAGIPAKHAPRRKRRRGGRRWCATDRHRSSKGTAARPRRSAAHDLQVVRGRAPGGGGRDFHARRRATGRHPATTPWTRRCAGASTGSRLPMPRCWAAAPSRGGASGRRRCGARLLAFAGDEVAGPGQVCARRESLEECAVECSSNSSCVAYAYANLSTTRTARDKTRCLVWAGNLIDTKKIGGVVGSDTLYLRLAG